MKIRLIRKEDLEALFPDGWRNKTLLHVGFIVGFLALMLVYFQPLLDGKILRTTDSVQFKGMSQEIRDYRAQGEEPLWLSRMFGGMPTYQVGLAYPGNLLKKVETGLKFGFGFPLSVVFLLFLGFYLLMYVLKLDPWICALGAAGYALSSYFFIASEAGHTSKVNALVYVAPIIAGAILTFRGKWLWGGVLTALFLGFQLVVNHYQITYYTLIILGVFIVAQGIIALQRSELVNFGKATGVIVVAGLLALAPNYGRISMTQEYVKESKRGPAVLKDQEGPKSGLDRGYAFQWSYGVMESFTLLVPNFNGGASGTDVGTSSASYKILTEKFRQPPGQAEQTVKNLPTYWGAQPFTSGPVYIGALLVFLFVLGLLIVDPKDRWWLLAATIISLMLAWGKNFAGLNDILFDLLPMYNKFRAPAMILIIAQFTIPLMAALALQKIIVAAREKRAEELLRPLYIAGGVVGGLLAIIALLGPGLFGFSGPSDSQLPPDFLPALVEDRQSLLQMDALRSLLIVAIGAGGIWALFTNKIKANILLPALLLVTVADLWLVNKRYLTEENFQEEEVTEISPDVADNIILQDQDPNFRVLDITRSDPWQEAFTSYFHKHIGGYHAAKLRRYDDLIARQHQVAQQRLQAALKSGGANPAPAVQAAMAQCPTFNMLNLKYFIHNGKQQPITNPHNLGDAWFVEDIQILETPDQVMNALGNFNPAQVAFVEKASAGILEGFDPQKDANGSITLTSFHPNRMNYDYNASSEQLVVFSEVYYNSGKGWNAYIDGKKVDHTRVNYVLRAMRVPAGQHKIEFKFESPKYAMGNTLGLFGSLIILLGFIGIGYIEILKQADKNKAEQEQRAAEEAERKAQAEERRKARQEAKRKAREGSGRKEDGHVASRVRSRKKPESSAGSGSKSGSSGASKKKGTNKNSSKNSSSKKKKN